MRTAAAYLLLAATPAAAFWAARVALERVTLRSRPVRGPAPAGRSLERLVDDLRRLEQDHRRITRSDAPGRVARLRAVSLAYDDALRACCRAVGLPEPQQPPLTPVGRLEAEAALAQAGVTW